MIYYYLTALLIICHSLLGWQKEPTALMKERVAPYLLPENHPAKEVLDALFATRVSVDVASLEKAGFIGLKLLHGGQTIATHSALPALFFKLVVDRKSQSWSFENKGYRKQDEYLEFTARIQKREELQQLILQHGITTIILPKKWIYPIPTTTEPPPGMIKKFYLLVAEDMHILHEPENGKAWKENITKQHLDELFILMTEGHLSDINPFNLPFCDDGVTLALIDTKPRARDRMDLREIDNYLNREMLTYWHSLIR